MRIQTKITLVLLSLSILALSAAGVFTTLSVGHYLRSRIVGELKTESEQIDLFLRNRLLSGTGAYETLRSFARRARQPRHARRPGRHGHLRFGRPGGRPRPSGKSRAQAGSRGSPPRQDRHQHQAQRDDRPGPHLPREAGHPAARHRGRFRVGGRHPPQHSPHAGRFRDRRNQDQHHPRQRLRLRRRRDRHRIHVAPPLPADRRDGRRRRPRPRRGARPEDRGPLERRARANWAKPSTP